jgi:hypothetical protein
MSEPKLENISDYNTLEGEKKRVVWAVIVASLIIGSIYTVAQTIYGNVDDSIPVQKSIVVAPKGTISMPVQ